MAIKEVREWFLRTAAVPAGTKRDRESTFNKQYTDDAKLNKYKLFLQNHIPSETAFVKLFEALAFKLNPEDTAFEEQQGLVQKATDAKSITRVSSDNGIFESDGTTKNIGGYSDEITIGSGSDQRLFTTGFTTVVRPHQLPNVHNDDNVDGTDTSISSNTANGLIVEQVNTEVNLDGTVPAPLNGSGNRRNVVIKVAVGGQVEIDGNGAVNTNGHSGAVVIDGTTLTFVNGILTTVA